MSRIGKRSVAIPSGVTANINGNTLSVKGPKGSLEMGLSDLIEYKLEDGEISVKPANETRQARNHWGMQRTMVSNLVEGVTEGFTKVLEINGVGYRAQAQGKKLKLQLGYSHDVDLDVPEGIEVNHRRNLEFWSSSCIFSMMPSRIGMNEGLKWQFCSTTHWWIS